MTPETLKEQRKELGLNRADLARRLKTPYPTIRDYESGARRIPGIVEVTMQLLLERDQALMDRIKNRIVKK